MSDISEAAKIAAEERLDSAGEVLSGGSYQIVEEFQHNFLNLSGEIGKVIVGYKDAIELVLTAFCSDGHVLIEGVPGLGKTLLVKSLGRALGFPFKRIQFTPDLMPADITGTQLVMEREDGHREFEFSPGPIFANIILADEVNRATPKTQSALLEAMEEKQVTVAGRTRRLNDPCFVMATQNPIEMEGTYPLPEAQMDRFFFKLNVAPPEADELKEILERTTVNETYEAKRVFSESDTPGIVENMKRLVRSVLLSSKVEDYIVKIMMAARPNRDDTFGLAPRESEEKSKKNRKSNLAERYIEFGPSPRGAQALVLGGKVMALLDGRVNVSFEDIDKVMIPALNHRLVLNFAAEADGVDSTMILREVLEEVKRSER